VSLNSEFNTKLAAVVSFILTPLYTISVALQTSIGVHKDIHLETPTTTKSKEVTIKPTQLTLAEKRRLELMFRSGGTHKPYTAPVYDGIKSAFKGLYSQGGVQGLYKGGLIRLFINSFNTYCQSYMAYNIYKE
jgi:hypothetical protein